MRNITFCLDNARICKNRYLLGWANELVERGRFDCVRFFYMVVGHTKFQPDRLFSSIAKTFYKRDVFCIEMLDAIAKQYSTSYIFQSHQILQWRSALEEKYLALPGITDLHDFTISKAVGSSVEHRQACYSGSHTVTSLQKPHSSDIECIPRSYTLNPGKLTNEKLRQLTEQHDRYIKVDVEGYIRPSFLHHQEHSSQDIASNTSKQKRCCSLCDGKGHIQQGKKRHYSVKYCPVAAKQSKS